MNVFFDMRRMASGGDVPYQRIDYLESSGSQYIDTLIIPNDKTGVRCIAYGNASDNFLLGLKDTNGNTRFAIGNTGNSRYYYGYTTTGGVLSATQDAKAILQLNYMDNKNFIVSDTDELVVRSQNLPNLGFTPQNCIRLFGSSGIVASYTSWSGKIYEVEISQGNEIIMHLIPVRIGTTGFMYDKVSEQLFGNDGSGNFILGNDI